MTGEADVPKNTSRAIVIPLDERTLGEFIASLLGQRRSIERNFNDRRFEIDSNWLLNLDDVILQRINSQHTAKLVSFSARIYFSNGKIVTLEEEKSFRHYNDISSEISVGVDLRWSFLIKFPLAGIPEKQEIRFAAFTDATIIGEVKAKERRSSRSFLSTRGEDERFLYSVQFTNVTWGEDLSATIDAYITGKSEGMPWWKQYIRRVPIGLSVPLTASVISLISLAALMGSDIADKVSSISKITTKYGDFDTIVRSLDTVEKKLSFLVDVTIIILQHEPVSVHYFIRTAIVCIAISCMFAMLSIRERSFISLNDVSHKHQKNRHAKYEFVKYGLLVAGVVGVVSGVFAIRIYDLIKDWL